MNISAFLGIVFGYIIAQIFIVKYLNGEKTNLRGCLITTAIVLTLQFLIFGEAFDCLAVVAGCAVGHFIINVFLRRK